MQLIVRAREGSGPGDQPVEVVERKGIGHPDTICDGIAERISVELCRYYLEHCGAILHHNVDKMLLCGGAARPAFRGGVIVEPIELYLGGRATEEHRGTNIPIHDIATRACRDWLREHLPELDVERDVRITSRLRPGSSELVFVFGRGGAAPLANDTSYGVGFAPLTELETAVLAVERTLNHPDTKRAHPELGQDIKVMGVRHDRSIQLTIGCAFVGRHLNSVADYAERKEAARRLAVAAAQAVTALEVRAVINAADDVARGQIFLTVSGTSAEAGDDGQVGRGNRVCGLITPYRMMTLEAAAGKNPVSHVGKIYNIVARQLAERLAREVPGLVDVTTLLVSAIGRPVDDPQLFDICLALTGGLDRRTTETARELARGSLHQIDALREGVLSQNIAVY